MKKIRYLTIFFDSEIEPYEVPAFRSAVIQTAGKEHILYHNHLKQNKFLYDYPKIQYKTVNKKPVIVCLNEGIDEIHHFFDNKGKSIVINNKNISLNVERIVLRNHLLQVWNKNYSYKLINWLPLNEKNYKKFSELANDEERISKLTNILNSNIISFAKGLNWTIEKPLNTTIHNYLPFKLIKYKNVKLMSTTINFSTNVYFPNYIGLGKAASKGFGIVKFLRDNNAND